MAPKIFIKSDSFVDLESEESKNREHDVLLRNKSSGILDDDMEYN